jgi:hypothetical protein
VTTYVSVDFVATVTNQQIFAAPIQSSYTITKAQALNVGTSNGRISLFRVAAGGVPSTTANLLTPPTTVDVNASNPTILPLSGQVVEQGKSLWGVCTTNASIIVGISYAIDPDPPS